MHAGSRSVQHASFILLAEFDIGQGSLLAHQYPYPTGIDEHILAEQMIPEGVHAVSEDWTIFFLNQTPENTVTNVFAPGDDDDDGTLAEKGEEKKELLYVLNLVQTKHDPSVKRGAIVKALAVCTHYPFIQIFKPVLLIALEDYYADPSVQCLARLFDAINAMDTSLSPSLTRDEKLIVRASERKDVFAEKFVAANNTSSVMTPSASNSTSKSLKTDQRKALGHVRNSESAGSSSQFSFVGQSTRKLSAATAAGPNYTPPTGDGKANTTQDPTLGTDRSRSPSLASTTEEDVGSSVGGSAIWVGGEDDTVGRSAGAEAILRHEDRGARKISLDRQSAVSSSLNHNGSGFLSSEKTLSEDQHGSRIGNHRHHLHHHRVVRDTHFFETSISYKGYTLPIKLPTSTFPEEVGDYSLIQLIQTFSTQNAIVTGPVHPHLHTQGPQTPPIILLFNALVTHKRVIFMGKGKPAGHVAQYVLAACALGSGSGCQLRGFTERAFPHGHLSIKSLMESIPGFIAGVTNPIYESLPIWDVLCNIETGKITVHKDITISVPAPTISAFPTPPPLNPRSGTVTAIGEDESIAAGGKAPVQMQPMMVGGGAVGLGTTKSDINKKEEYYDVQFIEDLLATIAMHYGETMVRARISEYVFRFVRISARYEETVQGSTEIGFSFHPFSETGVSPLATGLGIAQGFGGSLGSGLTLTDENVTVREMTSNASRIEGWRNTKSYEYWKLDFNTWLDLRAIQGFDVQHQISRLRNAKSLLDGEMELIMKSLYLGVRTYEQVVELLAALPPYAGGLAPIAFGLFHQSEFIRETTVDVLNIIRAQKIGSQFISNLNHFHRFAYIQMLAAREQQQKQAQAQAEQWDAPPLPTPQQQHQQRPSLPSSTSSSTMVASQSQSSSRRETVSGGTSLSSHYTNGPPSAFPAGGIMSMAPTLARTKSSSAVATTSNHWDF